MGTSNVTCTQSDLYLCLVYIFQLNVSLLSDFAENDNWYHKYAMLQFSKICKLINNVCVQRAKQCKTLFVDHIC